MKRLILALLALAAWGCAGTDGIAYDDDGAWVPHSAAAPDVPVTEQTELGTLKQPLEGIYSPSFGQESHGWKASGWDPNRCRRSTSDYCLVPSSRTSWTWGHVAMGLSVGTPIDDMTDANDDLVMIHADSGPSGPYGGVRIEFVSGSFQSSNWQTWSETWMRRVVRLRCKSYATVLEDNDNATWQQCKSVEAKVDMGRLGQWFSNHGISEFYQDLVKNHIAGYVLSAAAGGLGEQGNVPGYTYDKLNKDTDKIWQSRELSGIEGVYFNYFDPEAAPGAVDLGFVEFL